MVNNVLVFQWTNSLSFGIQAAYIYDLTVCLSFALLYEI